MQELPATPSCRSPDYQDFPQDRSIRCGPREIIKALRLAPEHSFMLSWL